MIGNLLNRILTRGLERYGRFYSTYRGFVLANTDPDNMKKLLVYCPQLTGLSKKGSWAYPKGIASGAKWGTNTVPQIGDLVWVEFEYGDPRYPIWSFGYRKKGDTEKLPIASGEKEYGFTTPNGNYVNISDDGDIITIKTTGGNTVILNDDAKYIELQSVGGLQVKLDDSEAKIILNGGNQNGIPLSYNVAAEINVIKSRLASHEHIYLNSAGITTPTLPDLSTNSALSPTTLGDIENPNIIQ